MNSMKLLLLVIVFTSLVLSSLATLSSEQKEEGHDLDTYSENELSEVHDLDDNANEVSEDDDDDEDEEFYGVGRALLGKKRTRRLTCKKRPRVCLAKGSPGPNCCKKKCVDLLRDRMNCGKCGHKCKYNKICCNGKCVNPSFNRNHCGGCNSGCQKGEFCLMGLCNYA